MTTGKHGKGDVTGLGTAETPTLEPLAQRYLESRVRVGELRRQTAYEQQFILRSFVESFGHRQVQMLGRSDVERWLETIGHLAPSTRRAKLSVVKGFCRWLVIQEKVKRDPSIGIRSPRQPRALPRVLERPSFAALLEACPDARARLIILLMCQLGLRCIEVSRLELGDISPTQIRVRGKGGHERALPLLPEVRAALNVYLGERGMRGGALIQNYTRPGRGITSHTISQLVRGLMLEAGVKLAPHDGRSAHGLRRTCATDMLAEGCDIIDVAEALGHANLASVRHYAKYNTAEAVNGHGRAHVLHLRDSRPPARSGAARPWRSSLSATFQWSSRGRRHPGPSSSPPGRLEGKPYGGMDETIWESDGSVGRRRGDGSNVCACGGCGSASVG